MKKLAVTICATQKYSYAVNSQAYSLQSAIFEYLRSRKQDVLQVVIILVSEGCDKIKKLQSLYENILSSPSIDLKIIHKILPDIIEPKVGYKTTAQRLIAKLRSEAFLIAKQECPDFCLSLDSDILIKANSLIAMEDTLNFDSGYYSVVMNNYPSQGGGPFLGGRGTYSRRILDNVYDEEKPVPEKILKRVESLKDKHAELVKSLTSLSSEEKFNTYKELKRLSSKIHSWSKYINKKVQSKDNVFLLNSKGWKKRGWFDFAYPAIGKGSIVPTDWTGFGCLLINQKALNFIDFHGYIGEGTEDLFINWERWFPNGIKMACLPHCPADHVIRKRIKGRESFNDLFLISSSHETSGEYEGHLRQVMKPFVDYL
jgi:hypothetical protein